MAPPISGTRVPFAGSTVNCENMLRALSGRAMDYQSIDTRSSGSIPGRKVTCLRYMLLPWRLLQGHDCFLAHHRENDTDSIAVQRADTVFLYILKLIDPDLEGDPGHHYKIKDQLKQRSAIDLGSPSQ